MKLTGRVCIGLQGQKQLLGGVQPLRPHDPPLIRLTLIRSRQRRLCKRRRPSNRITPGRTSAVTLRCFPRGIPAVQELGHVLVDLLLGDRQDAAPCPGALRPEPLYDAPQRRGVPVGGLQKGTSLTI